MNICNKSRDKALIGYVNWSCVHFTHV